MFLTWRRELLSEFWRETLRDRQSPLNLLYRQTRRASLRRSGSGQKKSGTPNSSSLAQNAKCLDRLPFSSQLHETKRFAAEFTHKLLESGPTDYNVARLGDGSLQSAGDVHRV